MTNFDHNVLAVAQYLFSGLVFRSIAEGHWSDWTKKQNNINFKFVIVVMSWFCFVEAFVLMIAMAFGGVWAMVMLWTVLIGWYLWDRTFQED